MVAQMGDQLVDYLAAWKVASTDIQTAVSRVE